MSLSSQTELWLQRLKLQKSSLPSLFFGGGTPGIFAKEYGTLFDLLKSYLAADAEICLEVNPNNLNREHLQEWSELGFNRLSIGVQSFNDRGLKILTRDHSRQQALEGIERAHHFFDNISIDLIYGWPTQTLTEWQQDLEIALECDPKHLSCYNLTYEEKTPFMKLKKRGVHKILAEEVEEQMYQQSCEYLAAMGFEHYEVSNWAKSGFKSVHNQRYWNMQPYVGIGAGAHGFVWDKNQVIGTRYAYTQQITDFANLTSELLIQEDQRDMRSWQTEILLTGLRLRTGLLRSQIEPWMDMNRLDAKYYEQNEGRISLKESEWFRLNAHIHQLLKY